jgi:phosphate transport system substrate-binding protein
MQSRRALLNAAVAALAAVTFIAGCFDDQQSNATAGDEAGRLVINGAGATFPEPLYQRWIDDYQKTAPDVAFRYEGVGSGEGIKRFLAETVDFGASDAAMSDADLAKVGDRGVVMVPMTAGMVVLAYNLPGIDDLRLPRDVLVDIFGGRIAYWDDPRIAAANPRLNLPHRSITPVVRRDSSGTTFILTNHLSAVDDWWRTEGPGVGKQIDWPGKAMEVNYNAGVAERVRIAEGAIGYMEYEFADRLGLPIAALQNKAGQYVRPSPPAGTEALASADVIPDDLRVFIPDPPGAGAYPIVSYTWLLLYQRYPEPAKAAALRDAVDWGLSDAGQRVAESMRYIPLPEQMKALAMGKVSSIQ